MSFTDLQPCPLLFQGNKQVTDVTVKGLRAKGFHNRALYNLIGPGAWVVIDCTAMFPDSEGFVQPRSLLPKTSKVQQQQQQQEGVCETCSASPSSGKAPASSEQDSQQQGTGGTRSNWWKWLAWGGRSRRKDEQEHNSNSGRTR